MKLLRRCVPRKVFDEAGFTLVELVLAIGILMLVFSFTILNLRQAQNQTSLNSLIPVVIGDIKSQQVKAMNGFGDETTSSEQGIFFDTQQYILFQGEVYQPGNVNNFVIPLEENFRFESITFTDSQVRFNPGSGEVDDFLEGSNSFVIRNIADNEVRRITINELGVISEVEEL